jgi:hypothetical protein
MMAFLPIPAPVYCGSLLVVQSVFPCPLFIGYGIAGNRVTNRIPFTSNACRITASRFSLEHTRPHGLCCHRFSSPPTREPADHRQSKSGVGETSLVPNQWQAMLQDVPVADRNMVLFMQAARWADDIRSNDRAHNRPPASDR